MPLFEKVGSCLAKITRLLPFHWGLTWQEESTKKFEQLKKLLAYLAS